ncbi:MAG: trypsin-like peptidase domain-containing protein [Acidimicrobiia bacterium]
MVLTILGGVLLGTGLTLGALGVLGLLAPADVTSAADTVTTTTSTTAAVQAASAPASVSQVAATAIPSIAAVDTTDSTGLLVSGSAVVYGDGGYLITNNHVVQDAVSIFVTFADGVGYRGELVGTDPLTDIAVISTHRPDLTPIELGSEDKLQIGQPAVAVGNPLGLLGGPSVTTGIISALGRSLTVEGETRLYGLLQTDAPITRGSSGGALLDERAHLIGITTAIGVSDVGAEGLGFAVPVDLATGVADDLIHDGTVHHAQLGISGNSFTDTRDEAEVPVGVGVVNLTQDSAYGAAGGQVQDVIVSLDGQPVTTIDQLIARLRKRRAGDEISVQAVRGSQHVDLAVTLGEWTSG